MAAICEITGLWDQVKAAPYLSREQWRAFNLLILCQLIGGTPFMGSCTVSGLWNQVKGNPPYISEQEFMAENINLLCQLLNGGGGGGIGDLTQVRSGHGAPDEPGGTLPIIYFDLDCAAFWYWSPPPISIWTQQNLGKATGQYVVPTVVELRQIATVLCPPLWARTYGNVVAFGAQGSEYGWNPDSTEDDDGMETIKPDDVDASDPGRWEQLP